MFFLCASLAFCEQDLINNDAVAPALKTLEIKLVESGAVVPGEHHFVFHLGDGQRDRYLELRVDQSVCKGKLELNGATIEAGDVTTMVRFDAGNRVSVDGCLELTPKPVELKAYPKVHIAKAIARRRGPGWETEFTMRNTLLNSSTCTVTASGYREDFFVGPETSQTRSFFVRLDKWKDPSMTLELDKFEEAMEGVYWHIYRIELPRLTP